MRDKLYEHTNTFWGCVLLLFSFPFKMPPRLIMIVVVLARGSFYNLHACNTSMKSTVLFMCADLFWFLEMQIEALYVMFAFARILAYLAYSI